LKKQCFHDNKQKNRRRKKIEHFYSQSSIFLLICKEKMKTKTNHSLKNHHEGFIRVPEKKNRKKKKTKKS